jgi:hypothetical protein
MAFRATIGIEVESVKYSVTQFPSMKDWSVTEDGSIRHQKPYSKYADVGEINHGVEFVSRVLKIQEYYKVFELIEFLECAGALPRANNAIHIHVGLPVNKIYIEDIVDYYKFCKSYLERDFFSFSVDKNQKNHRGVYNDFIYCRPLSSPPYSLDSSVGKYFPTHGKVENVSSFEELRYAIGRSDIATRKWWPPRYTGINFLTSKRMREINTIEFRMFNFTTNKKLLLSWMLAAAGSIHSFFHKGMRLSFLEALKYSCKALNLSSNRIVKEAVKNRRNVWESIKKSPTKSHTGQRINWSWCSPYQHLNPPEMLGEKSLDSVENPHPTESLVEAGSSYYTII